MTDLYREIELTIMNTETLYNLAKDVTDIKLDNNQISNLASAIMRQIAKNSGEPHVSLTDNIKKIVRSVVVDVQLPEVA